MSDIQLPESLKGETTMENKEWYKQMMAKFNKLNENFIYFIFIKKIDNNLKLTV